VIVSETVESSSRVRVASPNSTSTTVAVHCGFGHDPAGAAGVLVDTVKRVLYVIPALVAIDLRR